MVTSNKVPEKKVLKMTEQNSSSIVVPQKTLLGEVNEHITCPLCHGYYIDATTIVECLHSFCRSCVIKHLQVKSYCPVCEMMINSAKPNIKPDKALQDIVYKLVPGLFQREMERRQHFYASRPGPAASATPEQRGEDTERIIFSPEDVISFSLEYADATDTDSISSKSSDSNETQPTTATSRRFLQCPAVVNISHLKKFISMKFDIDSTQFAIDILYKRVPLSDYYTLMDIAYIYNWKRNEPMRFFYQITDYIAIRTRYGLFDINRNGSQFRDIKSSPTPTEDTNASSPAPTLNEPLFEASSGTESPMPEDSNIKKETDSSKPTEQLTINSTNKATSQTSQKKNNEEVEKSEFLNSFELTAKSSCSTIKPVTVKLNRESIKIPSEQNKNENAGNSKTINTNSSIKTDDSVMKRKQTLPEKSEIKKAKFEISGNQIASQQSQHSVKSSGSLQNVNKQEHMPKITAIPQNTLSAENLNLHSQNSKQVPDSNPLKKLGPGVLQSSASPKHKSTDSKVVPPAPQSTSKAISASKPTTVKLESTSIKSESQKHVNKKIPDLKPSIPQMSTTHKNQAIGKVRMDLLANNSDPTIDRSKILSQVKTSLGPHNSGPVGGDPLKSLFDSCKINIPSSLSITLTDQKQEQRNPNEQNPTESKKNVVNKNLALGAGNLGSHKVPSPPVHNYIEILKLPDGDKSSQQQKKTELQSKSSATAKTDQGAAQPKPPAKQSESSAKGPIPSLKPIADTKLPKVSASGSNAGALTAATATATSSPITFQQTFEQQLQSEKTKLPKNKLQVPKLMPATPKAISAANKLNNAKTYSPESKPITAKPDKVLDLSTPHNIQSHLDPQQTKKFETMQSIANLAKKQIMTSKTHSSPQSILFTAGTSRSISSGSSSTKTPTSNVNQIKIDKVSPLNPQPTSRQDLPNKSSISKPLSGNPIPGTSSPTFQPGNHHSSSSSQQSPRSQTRSPSSSPKLVIAEDKHTISVSEQNINQSNQISSTQLVNVPKSISPSASPSTSKQTLKPTKAVISTGRFPAPLQVPQNVTNIRTGAPLHNPADFLSQPQLLSAQHAILRHHMEMQNAWIKAQRQYDLFKNMSNINHQPQNNNKDNKQ